MSLGPFLTAVLLPPTNLVVLGLAGVAVAARSARVGRAIAVAALCGLLVLALPYTAQRLAVSLSGDGITAPGPAPPGAAKLGAANLGAAKLGAVVILAAEVRRAAGGPLAIDLGPLTLERLRRGAILARQTGLPILVAGGPWREGQASTASVMADSLRDDFGVAARWTEDRSQNTFENAANSAVMLRANGIARVYLVTHAWHMRRSELAFRKVGIETVAVPVGIEPLLALRLSDFVPQPEAWVTSLYCLHEWVGYLVYAAFR